MGQKTHPYGFRLVYNQTWHSRWYAESNYADTLLEDVNLRMQLKKRLRARRGQRGRHRARRRAHADHHLHLAAGHHHRPQGCRGGQAARRPDQAARARGPHQHPGDPAARARRAARGAVDRRAARAPGLVPPRHAQGDGVGVPLRCQGREDHGRRPPGRSRDRAHRVVPGRPSAAAHPQGRHRLRARRGAHHLRP